MTRYSPVSPIALLWDMQKKDILGGYLLLLAHDVLDNRSAYRRLVKNVRKKNSDTFIIMDNSLIELGEAMNFKTVVEAADVVNADCIITPDALGGFEATQELILGQLDDITNCGYPLMCVPQGRDSAELVKCVDWLRTIFPTTEGQEYWGIPRWITNKIGSRIPICQYISMSAKEGVDVGIHLLGMSESYEEDMRTASFEDVMGMDSANPIALGFAGIDMCQRHRPHIPREDLFMETEMHPTAILNVEFMHNAIDT